MSENYYRLKLSQAFPGVHEIFSASAPALMEEEVLCSHPVEGVRRQASFKVGVIGTRKPSHYGLRVVKEFLEICAHQKDWIWVSGGAIGIDGEVHSCALEMNLHSQAWLVGPIENPNPPSHWKIFQQLREREGCGIFVPAKLEPTLGAGIFPSCWLERNRWLAADVDALVVVEAHEQSGTWNTVSRALDYGKEVFVVPGSIFSPSSRGTNLMISKGNGHTVESLEQLSQMLQELRREKAVK